MVEYMVTRSIAPNVPSIAEERHKNPKTRVDKMNKPPTDNIQACEFEVSLK